MDSLDEDIKAVQEFFPEYSCEIEIPYHSLIQQPPPPPPPLPPPPPFLFQPPDVVQLERAPPHPEMTPPTSVGKTLPAPKRKRKTTPTKESSKRPKKVERRSSSSESDVNGPPPKVKKAIVDGARKRVKEALANDGEVEYEIGSNKNRSNWPWLWTIEKGLRFSLCDNCVKLYLKDEKKVTELESNYIMVSLVMCPKCIDGNNNAKRAYKEAFGKPWNKSSWRR
jgi:hypothetical protein